AGLIAGLATALVTVLGQGMFDYTLRAAVIFTGLAGILGALLAMARFELAEPGPGPDSPPEALPEPVPQLS
ncbi:MAG: hypothetical protein M3N31_08485, partial [Actinomycetota bacterium]|nr:hypothetical protein [Actinomycetota bacterium]